MNAKQRRKERRKLLRLNVSEFIQKCMDNSDILNSPSVEIPSGLTPEQIVEFIFNNIFNKNEEIKGYYDEQIR